MVVKTFPKSEMVEVVGHSSYQEPAWKIWKHKRYIMAILIFLGLMNLYALRTNLSIALVDMTAMKNITLEDGTTVLKPEFDWSSPTQGYVLSSFFYGYVTTQLLGGYLVLKFGGTRVFGFGIASTALFTLVTPWVAKTNVYFLIALRTLEGALEGLTFPGVQAIWSHWAPPSEKTRLVSTSMSGSYFGAVVAMPICSLLATAFGWEFIFYALGAIGLFWYSAWVIFAFETPSSDSRIDPRERDYINESINTIPAEEKPKVPIFKILTSKGVFANTTAFFCESWGFYTMMTYLPKMMNSLLGFDLNASGFLSALPYLAMTILFQVSGHVSDFILRRGYLSVTFVRKLFIFIGFTGQGVFLLAAGYWIDRFGTSFCLVAAVGLGGCALSAATVNPLDIAPKYSSVIVGINNTFGAMAGIMSPILTGYLVTDQASVIQWRLVFFISSGVYLFGMLVSMVFATGKKQKWAE